MTDEMKKSVKHATRTAKEVLDDAAGQLQDVRNGVAAASLTANGIPHDMGAEFLLRMRF